MGCFQCYSVYVEINFIFNTAGSTQGLLFAATDASGYMSKSTRGNVYGCLYSGATGTQTTRSR